MGATSYPTAQNRRLEVPADHLRVALALHWKQTHAETFGISLEQFEGMVVSLGAAAHWGAPAADQPTTAQKKSFLDALHCDDLVLARACARGNDQAWSIFLERFRKPLLSAACAIAREESRGRELADSLYADLYGLQEREGERRSRFESYSGRGSLLGWLRSILAQRFVDHYRQRRHDVALDEEMERSIPAAAPEQVPAPDELRTIATCVREVLDNIGPDDRFLLSSYYLDGRRLIEIGRVLQVHESTVSRRLERVTRELRKCLLRSLERKGLSYPQAVEALQVDVRDLDIPLRRWLQAGAPAAFQEKGVLR